MPDRHAPKACDCGRIMRIAHAEWRAVRGRPGWDFARCLRLSWAVEKRRLAGSEYYQPPLVNGPLDQLHLSALSC